MDPFGPAYAAAYDVLYAEKDYEGECDLLERLFRAHAPDGVRRILDLGCGTGGHVRPLAARGYEVVGVDRSDSMLDAARRKATATARPSRFVTADIRTVRLEGAFDAALILFAVLGYQERDEDVAAALETARVHLRPGGLLAFDHWHGPAVVRGGPRESRAVRPVPGGEIRRIGTPRLDPERRICTMRYRLEREVGGVVEATEETHRMRYFFPDEISGLLDRAGFEPIRIGAFPDFDREPSESTWTAMAVSRRR